MDIEVESPYKNGHWVWDEGINGVIFLRRRETGTLLQSESSDGEEEECEEDERPVFQANHEPTVTVSMVVPLSPPKSKKQAISSSIRFKDNVDSLKKIQFRRFFQRRVLPNEPEIITIQDIKDVVLYLANPKDLSVEFIKYFHIPEIDRFLKAMIAYFHYYLQVWETILARREEAKRKITQPVVTELENIVRDDLADLRSMVAREYCTIVLGLGKCAKYHHLSTGTNSLSEKDRRLWESLICVTVRVIWIALQRRYLGLIELEVNRLLRTDIFNLVLHRRNKPSRHLWRSPAEERVLVGTANLKETKLKQRSGLTKELLLAEHDYRMLGLGFKEFEPSSDRIDYLSYIFAIPDEELLEHGVTIGLIGIPREEYDAMMLQRERTLKNFDKVTIEAAVYKFPKRVDVADKDMPMTFPKKKCRSTDTAYTIKARAEQCAVWIDHLTNKKPRVEALLDEDEPN